MHWSLQKFFEYTEKDKYDEMYQNASNDNIDVKTNFISDMYRVYIYLQEWRSILYVAQFTMYV